MPERGLWRRGILALGAAAALVGSACGRQTEARREPEPFEGYEPAEATSVERGDRGVATLYVTPHAVVYGSRVLGRLEGGAIAGSDLERIVRTVTRRPEGRRGFALAVDRRAAFGVIRPTLDRLARAGAPAVEVRVGPRGGDAALRLCLSSPVEPPAPSAADCWGRPRPRPSRSSTGAGPGRDGGGGAGDGGAATTAPAPTIPRSSGADVTDAPPSFDWDAPLRLHLTVEPDWVELRIQGQSLRTLVSSADEPAVSERMVEAFRPTLANVRGHAPWERRAALRVADEVDWQSVVRLVELLRSAGFVQVTLVGLERSTRRARATS